MCNEIDNCEINVKKLHKQAILTHFPEKDFNVIVYGTIGSTNTEARRLLEKGNEPPFLLVSEEQTAGRGRHGNSFFSPESGLYYTLVIRPEHIEEAIAKTTIAAAVSLLEAIRETAAITCEIKWVNDLYYQNRKVAGILCEAPRIHSQSVKDIIIGIGVNISQSVFPEELIGKAGSLGRPDLDRNRLAGILTSKLLYWCSHLNDPKLIALYKKHSFLLGKEVSFLLNGTEHQGTARDITADGNLIVEGSETWILSSGEVSLSRWESK